MKYTLSKAELILNSTGRIYHLDLAPDEIAHTIFLVGDPDRVSLVSQFFDRVEVKRQHREFITHTGYVGAHRVSVVSTGISSANIDIVLNELDALVNIDLSTRQIKTELTQLNFIRIGTAGALQEDIELDSIVATTTGIELGSLLNFYSKPYSLHEKKIKTSLIEQLPFAAHDISVTVSEGSQTLLNLFKQDCHTGMTVTCPGFYAPQGRSLRVEPAISNMLSDLVHFQEGDHRILNLEMETAAIYGLGQVLNHHCLSLSAIVAHRLRGEFCVNLQKSVRNLIELAIGKVTEGLPPMPEIQSSKMV